MDKITKTLNKLSDKERKIIQNLVEKIMSENLKGLDIKKLKGFGGLYRVRKGGLRIIFERSSNNKISVLSIDKRKEDTYKNL